jgi:hypothetical protein
MKIAMPKVKKAQTAQDEGNFAEAIKLYEDALADFTGGQWPPNHACARTRRAQEATTITMNHTLLKA